METTHNLIGNVSIIVQFWIQRLFIKTIFILVQFCGSVRMTHQVEILNVLELK